jgi:hypothetical protein
MDGGLSVGTYWQAAAEGLKEKILNFRRIGDGPRSVAVEAD